MADIRISSYDVQIAGTTDADPRLTSQSIEVLGSLSQPELVVTQFYVDVAGVKSGSLRVGRVYLEVLRELVAPSEIDVSASNILSLSTASHQDYIQRDASNSLAFTSSASETLFRGAQPLSQSLAFTSIASYTLLKFRYDVAQTLAFTETVGVGRPIRVSATNVENELHGYAGFTGPKPVSATTILDVVGFARIPEVYTRSVVTNIVLNQPVGLYGSRSYELSNTLSFSGYADNSIKVRSVTTEVDLSSVASGYATKQLTSELELSSIAQKGIHNEHVENELEFGQLVHINPITIGPGPRDRVSLPAQEIAFEQSAYTNLKSLVASTEIELGHLLHVVQPIYVSADSIMQWTEETTDPNNGTVSTILFGLQDAATFEIDRIIPQESPVWFDQFAKKVLVKVGAVSISASNELNLSQSVPKIKYLDASSSLDFEDYADLRHEFPATELSLESTVTYNVNYAPRLASNELDIISSFFAVPDKFSLCTYSPFIGNTNDPAAPQNVLKNQPIIDPNRHGVTLFHPWELPTQTINLRGPDLGNRDRLEFQRIKRETRGGTLVVWSDPMWPKNQRMVLSFSGLSESEGQNLLTFLTTTLGQEIGLVDWEGNTWRVVAMTPSEPLVRNSRCNLSINQDFEITRSTLRGRCADEIQFNDSASAMIVRNFYVEQELGFFEGVVQEMV